MFSIDEKHMKDPNTSPSTKLVFAVISTFSKDRPADNLSYRSIAQKTALTEVTVIRCVKQLLDMGWLVVAKNYKGWNVYGVGDE